MPRDRRWDDDDWDDIPRGRRPRGDDRYDREEDRLDRGDVRPRRWDDRPSGPSAGLIVGLVGGGVALVAGVVLLIVLLGRSDGATPRGAFDSYAAELKRGRYDRAFEQLSQSGRRKYELRGMEKGERAVDVFADVVRDDPWMTHPYTILDEDVSPDGQSARLTIAWDLPAGRFDPGPGFGRDTEIVDLVREDGKWKIDP